jgi:hypothetical protein
MICNTPCEDQPGEDHEVQAGQHCEPALAVTDEVVFAQIFRRVLLPGPIIVPDGRTH